jgi:hypothetical protein
MRFQHSTTMRLAICAVVGSLSALAQSGQTTIATVSSSYPIAAQTVGNNKYSVSLGIGYPIGLSPSSYILGTQLNTDIQNFASGYPNPADPPEAIFSSVLSSLLAKYPQMSLATLSAEVPPVIVGTVITYGPTITVSIGTYSTVAVGLASQTPAIAHARPPATVTPAPAAKAGN